MKNCRSCGMPLDEKYVSKLDSDYCIYCQNQETGEFASFEEVKAGSIGAAIKMGKTKEEAEKMADEMLPNMPHWKK